MFDGHALLLVIVAVFFGARGWIKARTDVRDDVRDIRRPHTRRRPC